MFHLFKKSYTLLMRSVGNHSEAWDSHLIILDGNDRYFASIDCELRLNEVDVLFLVLKKAFSIPKDLDFEWECFNGFDWLVSRHFSTFLTDWVKFSGLTLAYNTASNLFISFFNFKLFLTNFSTLFSTFFNYPIYPSLSFTKPVRRSICLSLSAII